MHSTALQCEARVASAIADAAASLRLALAAVLTLCASTLASGSPVKSAHQDGPPHTPREILVKFNQDLPVALQRGLTSADAVSAMQLPDSIERLCAKYRVRRFEPVFEDFDAVRQRLLALRHKDQDLMTEAERRLARRSRRVPASVPIPRLERVYKLEIGLNMSVEAATVEFGNDPRVDYAEPDYYLSIDLPPNDPYFSAQWSLHNTGQPYPVPGGGSSSGAADSDVDALEAWEAYIPSDDVIVAIIDTGVDYTHAELVPNMWTDGSGHFGYDFVNHRSDPMDDHGHGTHCAGIVAAAFDNGAGISGLCPNARIMAVKILDAGGYGVAEDAAQAVYYAVNNGAEVLSNSYGFCFPSQTLQEAIDFAHSQGAIFVAAAGNENRAIPHYPGASEHVISVAAVDSSDVKAWFTTYGDWVDISAPGVDILSLRAANTDMYGDGQHSVDNVYYIASGTSMACPHVAAVAGLIISHHPTLTSGEITRRLLGTTDEITIPNPTFAHLLGSGRLNADSALTDEEHPAIRFAGFEIADGGSGNGDGILDPGETADLHVILHNLWGDAVDVTATLATSTSDLTILDAAGWYGTIPSGEQHGNAADPFQIHLSEEALPMIVIELSLGVTAAGGYSRSLAFTFTRPIEFQDGDWPIPHGQFAQPIPYDVDGDGAVELVVNDPAVFAMRIINPDGSVTATLGGGETWFTDPAVGDLQKDGHVEIIGVYRQWPSDPEQWYLTLWNESGVQAATELPLDYTYNNWGSPTLCDLDLDGDLEILLGGVAHDHNTIAITAFAWEVDAVDVQWEAVIPVDDVYRVTDVSVGDIDAGSPGGDGLPELIFATAKRLTDGGRVFALRADGQVADGWPISVAQGVEHPAALADLTGDGNLEIVVNTYSYGAFRGLRVWDHTGTLLWTGVGGGRTPTIADLDGDGDLEIVTQELAYHHDGTYTGWSYPSWNPMGVSVGDIDGDGRMEVLLGAGMTEGLLAYHYDGGSVTGFPLYVDPVNMHVSMTPVLADLDRDGDFEIAHTGTYMAVWDLVAPYDPSRIESGMYQYDAYRTGCYNAKVNLPPVWQIAPEDQVFDVGVVNEMFVQAADPEAKCVVYEGLNLPVGAYVVSQGQGLQFVWEPHVGNTVNHVTFRAIDADGERVEKTIRIVVTGQGGEIPTVSQWGLVVITLLLLTAGTLVIGRPHRGAA